MDFAGYRYITIFMLLAELAVMVLAYKRNPRLAMAAVLLSIAFKGQYLWIGRAIYAWQIAAIFGLFYLAAGKGKEAVIRTGGALGFFHKSMQLYFIYTILASITMWLVFAAEGLSDGVTQASVPRALTQTIYFLFIVGIYGLGLLAGRYLTFIELLRIIILIAAITAYGAIVQTLIMLFTGINIFPIIGSDDTISSAYIMDQTFRANSFAGEPKHLGLLMSMGLISYFAMRLLRIPTEGRFAAIKPLVMAIALMLSLSTTGIIVTAVGIGFLAATFFRQLRIADVAVAGGLALALLTQVIGSDVGYAAALEGQINRAGFEVQDESVMQALFANPGLILTGTGLGNIHLIAVDYLPPDFPLFRDDGYKANSGLFFVMGDSGLMGLLLLLAIPLFGMRSYVRMHRQFTPSQSNEALLALAIIVVSLISFLLRYDVSYFLLSGFVYTRLALLRAQALPPNGRRTPFLPPRSDMRPSR